MSFILGIVLVSLVTIAALFWKEIRYFFYKKPEHFD